MRTYAWTRDGCLFLVVSSLAIGDKHAFGRDVQRLAGCAVAWVFIFLLVSTAINPESRWALRNRQQPVAISAIGEFSRSDGVPVGRFCYRQAQGCGLGAADRVGHGGHCDWG